MIVLHHSRGSFGIPKEFLSGFALNQGVSFFFVLSGFILTYVYPKLEGGRAVVRFFVARFARVWPAHVFTLVLVVILGMHLKAVGAAADPTVAITAANLTMTQAWYPATAWFFSYNAVSWSISTEFFFYLAFPFLIANLHRTWPIKLILCVILLVVVISLCSWLKLPTYAAAHPHEVNRAGLLYIGPLARLAEFFLGMTTALFWKRRMPFFRQSPATMTALEIGCLAACTGMIMLLSNRSSVAGVTGDAWAGYLHNCGGALAFALLILVFATQKGYLSRFCGTRLLVLLGEVSFSIYLLHQILLRWAGTHWSPAVVSGGVAYATFWVVLLVGSWAVWRFAEIPARRLILRLAPSA
jgi:peptidoglycan/LPS O-acetylase OafA/YrhL